MAGAAPPARATAVPLPLALQHVAELFVFVAAFLEALARAATVEQARFALRLEAAFELLETMDPALLGGLEG